MNERDRMAPYKPIIFTIENFEFPSHYSIYESNVVEFWKPLTKKEEPRLNDYNDGRFYISSYGRVYDSYLQKYIEPVSSVGNKYYEQFSISELSDRGVITVKVHRAVMNLFMPIENSAQYQVNHIDGLHSNNDLRNLEWCTDAYNRYHAILNDLEDTIYGKNIVKLYPFEIHKIKELKDTGLYSNNQIIDMLGLRERGASRKLIERIYSGKSKLYSRYYK